MDSHSSLLEDVDWLSEETIPDRIPSALRTRVESTRKTFIRAATTALEEAPKETPRNILELDDIRSSYLDILERFRGPTGIQRRELSAFPEVRKDILLQLRSTASTVKKLDKTLAPRRDEMSLLEESESNISEQKDRQDQLEAVRRGTRASRERLKEALARKRELEQRLLELETGSRFEHLERARRELGSAKEQLHKVESRIRRRFSHLRRVFKKFSKKVYDNEYSLSSEGNKRLEGYIDSPIETVSAETAE
jgi:ribosome-binding protein aMBF1 (putative translation factor)